MKVWAGPVEFYSYNMKYGQSWGMYQNLCYEQIKLGRYGEAVGNCKKAAESGEPVAYNTLGVLWERLGSVSDAEGEYKLAVKAYPKFYPAWKDLVSMYVKQKRWDEALAAAERLVEIDPSSWEYRLMVGKVYWLQGNKMEAENNFEMVGKMAGDKSEVDQVIEEVKNNR